MSKKHKVIFELSEEELQVLQTIKEDVPEVKSRVDAVRFLIKKYEIEVIDAKQTLLRQQEEMLDLLKQMKRTINYTEQNTEISIDALNTLLMANGQDKGMLTDVYMHPLIKMSKENISEKIRKNQVIKHHNKNRKKG